MIELKPGAQCFGQFAAGNYNPIKMETTDGRLSDEN